MSDGQGDNKSDQMPVKLGKAIPRAIIPAARAARLPDAQAESPAAKSAQKQITMAAMIYALGAGILFVFACYNLTQGAWFNGIVTFLPAGGLLVLAYKYLQ